MPDPEIVEWYVVITVSAEAGLPVEESREEVAEFLRYAADRVAMPGFQGGVFGTEDGSEMEVHLAGPQGGSAFAFPGDEGEA